MNKEKNIIKEDGNGKEKGKFDPAAGSASIAKAEIQAVKDKIVEEAKTVVFSKHRPISYLARLCERLVSLESV